MNKKIKNFVFDLYGTLADIRTDEDDIRFKQKFTGFFKKYNSNNIDFFTEYANLCKNELNKAEPDFEIDLFSVFKKVCVLSCGGLPETEVKKIAEKFRSLSRSRLKTYKGIKGMLAQLKGKGARLYILSNAQECFTLPEIKKLGLDKYMTGIEISSSFGKMKPSPLFFEHILKKYSLNPAETVYTGNDFKADILGSKTQNLTAAYIKSNISPREDSVKQAAFVADFACDSVKELKAYLLSLAD